MAAVSLVDAFAKNWWIFLIRGIFAILFGILAFAMPSLTLVTLILLYGAYSLADGVTALWVGVSSRAWSLVLHGILGVIVGIYAFVYPGITAVVLLYVIAVGAIIRGIFEIIAAIRLRKEISNEWWLILGGVISIIFGIALVANPTAGLQALILIIGIYAIIFGVTMIILAFRLRGLRRGEAEVSSQT